MVWAEPELDVPGEEVSTGGARTNSISFPSSPAAQCSRVSVDTVTVAYDSMSVVGIPSPPSDPDAGVLL